MPHYILGMVDRALRTIEQRYACEAETGRVIILRTYIIVRIRSDQDSDNIARYSNAQVYTRTRCNYSKLARQIRPGSRYWLHSIVAWCYWTVFGLIRCACSHQYSQHGIVQVYALSCDRFMTLKL